MIRWQPRSEIIEIIISDSFYHNLRDIGIATVKGNLIENPYILEHSLSYFAYKVWIDRHIWIAVSVTI